MTREEAKSCIGTIEMLQRLAFNIHGVMDVIDADNCKKIIKALEQEPSYNSVNSLDESKLKNPKAKNFDILHFVADNAGLSTFEAIEKAYNMGVSEQEPILEKIRAEITELRDSYEKDNYHDEADALTTALAILDKNKAESELGCDDCILDDTDACRRGAGRAIDDEPCEGFLAESEPSESEDKE